jgi:hypothetical protein
MPSERKGGDGSLRVGKPDLLALTFKEAKECLEAEGRLYTVRETFAPFARAGCPVERYVANFKVSGEGIVELLICAKPVRQEFGRGVHDTGVACLDA